MRQGLSSVGKTRSAGDIAVPSTLGTMSVRGGSACAHRHLTRAAQRRIRSRVLEALGSLLKPRRDARAAPAARHKHQSFLTNRIFRAAKAGATKRTMQSSFGSR